MASLNDIETKIQSIIDILGVKTITGTLPLTFTTHTAGAADTWTIYGNDDQGTENLFDISSAVDGYINSSGVLTPPSQIPAEKSSDYIEIDGSTTYTFSAVGGFPSITGYAGWRAIAYYDSNKRFLARTAGEGTSDLSATSGSAAKYVRISYRSFGVANLQIMLTKGSTAPDHYIPYQKGVGEQRQDGYYVPLTVSQQGQQDKTVDIFIGDSPLTEGETVSKQSTGVDLELFEGENTISTTLYNKPEMKINYKWR